MSKSSKGSKAQKNRQNKALPEAEKPQSSAPSVLTAMEALEDCGTPYDHVKYPLLLKIALNVFATSVWRVTNPPPTDDMKIPNDLLVTCQAILAQCFMLCGDEIIRFIHASQENTSLFLKVKQSVEAVMYSLAAGGFGFAILQKIDTLSLPTMIESIMPELATLPQAIKLLPMAIVAASLQQVFPKMMTWAAAQLCGDKIVSSDIAKPVAAAASPETAALETVTEPRVPSKSTDSVVAFSASSPTTGSQILTEEQQAMMEQLREDQTALQSRLSENKISAPQRVAVEALLAKISAYLISDSEPLKSEDAQWLTCMWSEYQALHVQAENKIKELNINTQTVGAFITVALALPKMPATTEAVP